MLFTLSIQFDVIHVQEVSDGHSTSKPVSISTLSDDLAKEVKTYAESASLWYVLQLIVILYNSFGVSKLSDIFSTPKQSF